MYLICTATQLSSEWVIRIRKTFKKYNVELELSDKLRSAFKAKLWHMGKALPGAGGTKRKEILSKWSSSEDSTNLKFDIQAFNSKLSLQKRKAEANQQSLHDP